MSIHATSVLQFLRRLVPEKDTTDGDLLRRCASGPDEAAFTSLVQRHGPMVWGVCQRVLGNSHDAEDAFQATFLVLARKAGSMSPPRLLAAWLYGVAYRTALKARTERVRRHVKEQQVETRAFEEPSEEREWAEVRLVLDEEISRLPQKYRVPFVLCYLEGKTNEEAALLIGCPRGTVLSRLAWARERLRTRLTRRGVGLSAGALASLTSETVARAVVSTSLVSATVAFIAGRGDTSRVILLAEGACRAMLMSKVRTAAFVAMAALTITVAAVLTHFALADKPPEAKPEPPGVEERPITFRQTPVSGDDIIAVTGLNVYKYTLDIPKGDKFKVMLSETVSKDAEARVLFHSDFTKEADGPVTLRVSFLRRDRKMQGVLLSQEKDAEFRLDCEGCVPGGLATIVRLPLADIPGTEKLLAPIRSDKAWGSSKDGPTRLLAIVHNKPGKPVASFDTAYPQGELSIIRLPREE